MSRRRRFRPSPRRAATRGLATLATLMLLLLSALLAAAAAQRSALNEIRASAHQLQSAAALEAAEAGLEWTQAMLNTGHPIDTACRPSDGAEGSTFRARYLGAADAHGRFVPREPGTDGLPRRFACARSAGGWTCSCPEQGAPSLPRRSADPAPMFVVELVAGARPGSVDVHAVGCSHPARPCLAGAASRADANARLRVTLALLPALATAPTSTLTSLGPIDASSAALGLHNADALSGGLVAHAGGDVRGSALRISAPPGASPAAAVIGGDAALAALPPAQLFSRHFGIDPLQWRQQPGVHRLSCHAGCTTALLASIESDADVARIAIDGDLRLAGRLRVGSRERPVVLVIDGDLLLDGPVQIHGIVHSRNMRWNDLPVDGGGLLHGAVLLSSSYVGNAAADLVYDPALMLRLKRQAGTWIRVPGSWRDG